jgi:dipeptidyl aminopeptidase/acylaminoacyl peptidase
LGVWAGRRAWLVGAAAGLSLAFAENNWAAGLGIFEEHTDIGRVGKPGSMSYDPGSRSYLVTGSGENMWFTNDAFQLVWKRASGDFGLQAAVQWPGSGGNAHRKGCLMVRQGLEPDAAYVDVAVHGNGLISLQYRAERGGLTHEIQVRPPAAPPAEPLNAARVGLERQGEVFYVTMNERGMEPGQIAGAFTRLKLADPVYVGLAVCAHDNKASEQARFLEVALPPRATAGSGKAALHCALETIDVGSKDRRLRYHTTNHIEAPNWSRDGKYFIFNSDGRIERLAVEGSKPERIDTGFAQRCNNDHGLSPDGQWLAISDQSRGGKSLIYVVPSGGGAPRPRIAQSATGNSTFTRLACWEERRCA